MAQIANQDHLFIKVDSIEEGTITEEQKASIKEKYRQGILLDVVLYDNFATAKILGYSAGDEGLASITYAYEGIVKAIESFED